MLAVQETILSGLYREIDAYLLFVCRHLAASPHEDFRYRWIEGRIKSAASVVRNQRKGGWPPAEIWEQIDDMVGTRVVVVTDTDVRSLISRITVDPNCPAGQQEVHEIDQRDSTGYRATHLKGVVRRGGIRIGCEIQIRTALQDAWAVVSRADLHEHADVPEVLRSMARVEALHLAASDESLERIRAEARKVTPSSPTDLEAVPPGETPGELPEEAPKE